ncbi:MAG TPA: hypothetical protein VFX15_00175 [Actinomycetes bacterium]|nr:hypothetical protein [Actinomycetes bacterium]
MKRDPITRQRSPWVEVPERYVEAEGKYPMRFFLRRTGDGSLWAIVAIEPEIGWHLSISFRDAKNRLSRYPTWDEIAHAREVLLPPELGFVMHLPPLTTDEYVALHLTTMHLHQNPPPEGDL